MAADPPGVPSVVSIGGGPSHEVIALATAYAATKKRYFRVLDLGCGDGRNAFLLAGSNALVTAVDSSRESIEKLKALAQLYGRSIDAIADDVIGFNDPNWYDAVLGHGILHFLDNKDLGALLQRLKRKTRPGGYHIFAVSPFATAAEVIQDFKLVGHKNVLKKGALEKYYIDWEIVSHENYVKWDFHPGIGEHRHPIEKYIFRKPADASKQLIIAKEIALIANDAEQRLAILCDGRTPIGLCRDDILIACGDPDRTIQYCTEGPQFGFKRFSQEPYFLDLLFYGRFMLYVSNEIVSGLSLFESAFCELRSALAAKFTCGTSLPVSHKDELR